MRLNPIPAIVTTGLLLLGTLIVTAGGEESKTETFFKGRQVKVQLRELEPAAAAAVIARSTPLYSLYHCDGCEPEGRQFVKVIDNIEGDGTSTLWRGVQIEFSPGYPCHQFTSDEQIATAVNSGEISLSPTGYVYRCRLVNPDE
jgi:hypothetical protein